MCDFHSVLLLADGSIYHNAHNSHSRMLTERNIEPNRQDQYSKYWECEWDCIDDYPGHTKVIRNWEDVPPDLLDKIERYYRVLQADLRAGMLRPQYRTWNYADVQWIMAKRALTLGDEVFDFLETAEHESIWIASALAGRSDLSDERQERLAANRVARDALLRNVATRDDLKIKLIQDGGPLAAARVRLTPEGFETLISSVDVKMFTALSYNPDLPPELIPRLLPHITTEALTRLRWYRPIEDQWSIIQNELTARWNQGRIRSRGF